MNGNRLRRLDDDTPLPDGVIELVKKIYSHSDTDMVFEVQKQIGKMDINASGIAADILKLCGLSYKLKLYRTPLETDWKERVRQSAMK